MLWPLLFLSKLEKLLTMQVTVTFGEKVFVLTVDGDLGVENLKALCKAKTDVPVQDILLVLNSKAVDDTKKVGESGIADGDLLLMQTRMKRQTPQGADASGAGGPQLPDFSKIMVPGGAGGAGSGSGSSSSMGRSRSGSAGPSSSQQCPEDYPAVIWEMLRSNPEQLALLRQNSTRLADAYDSPDPEEFVWVLKEQYKSGTQMSAGKSNCVVLPTIFNVSLGSFLGKVEYCSRSL